MFHAFVKYTVMFLILEETVDHMGFCGTFYKPGAQTLPWNKFVEITVFIGWSVLFTVLVCWREDCPVVPGISYWPTSLNCLFCLKYIDFYLTVV